MLEYNIYLLISNSISICLLLVQLIVYICVKMTKTDDTFVLIKDYTNDIVVEEIE